MEVKMTPSPWQYVNFDYHAVYNNNNNNNKKEWSIFVTITQNKKNNNAYNNYIYEKLQHAVMINCWDLCAISMKNWWDIVKKENLPGKPVLEKRPTTGWH